MIVLIICLQDYSIIGGNENRALGPTPTSCVFSSTTIQLNTKINVITQFTNIPGLDTTTVFLIGNLAYYWQNNVLTQHPALKDFAISQLYFNVFVTTNNSIYFVSKGNMSSRIQKAEYEVLPKTQVGSLVRYNLFFVFDGALRMFGKCSYPFCEIERIIIRPESFDIPQNITDIHSSGRAFFVSNSTAWFGIGEPHALCNNKKDISISFERVFQGFEIKKIRTDSVGAIFMTPKSEMFKCNTSIIISAQKPPYKINDFATFEGLVLYDTIQGQYSSGWVIDGQKCIVAQEGAMIPISSDIDHDRIHADPVQRGFAIYLNTDINSTLPTLAIVGICFGVVALGLIIYGAIMVFAKGKRAKRLLREEFLVEEVPASRPSATDLTNL